MLKKEQFGTYLAGSVRVCDVTGGILKYPLTWWRDLCSIKHVRNVNSNWFQKGVARKVWNGV